MTHHFVTLFDRNYLAKGLCLYESLLQHSSEEFRLSILAMDESTVVILNELALPNVEVLPLKHFEYAMHLENVRAGRSPLEFFYTCASQLLEFILPWSDEGITYVDADVMFFSDPKRIYNELAGRSIGITPHRLIPSKKHLEANGLFNVGIVAIRNTDTGRRCIARWAAQCRERCSATVGCGDQFYLNEWPELYGAECVQLSAGINAGPWSIGNWKVTEGPNIDGEPLNSYHYHEFLEREDGTFQLTNYGLRNEDVGFIYKPYVEAILAAKRRILEAETRIEERQAEMQLQAERA